MPVERRRITIFLGWSAILSASATLFVHIDTFMLGIFVPSKFIGYYSTLFSVVLAAGSFISFSGVFLPVFTKIKKDRLFRGFRKAIKYSAMLAVPAAIGLSFIMIPAVRVIYGYDYAPEVYFIPLLLTSIFISLVLIEVILTGIYNSLFMGKESVKSPTMILIILTLLNILFNYIFIKFALNFGQEWTLLAVALATFFTRYANLFSLGILAKKRFGLSPDKFDLINPLLASAIMLGFLFLFNYLFNPGLWLSILMVILAAGVYFASILFMENKK